MLNRNLLALAAFALALTACDSKPPRQFTMDELAGKWQLQPESFPSLQNRMGQVPKNSQLVLSADGRFTSTDMPLEEFPPIRQYKFRSGRGTWRLIPQIIRHIEVIYDDKDVETLSVEADTNDSPFLVHAIGDPESSERWVWKKVRDRRLATH